MADRIRRNALLALIGLMLGCRPYNTDLLDKQTVGLPSMPAPVQTEPTPQASRQASPQASPKASRDDDDDIDGGAVVGNDNDNDNDNPSDMTAPLKGVCGDGLVSRDEECDTAIVQDRPGACPDRCGEPTDGCTVRLTLMGDECQRHCVATRISVRRSGDGCCPSGADSRTDDDCGICGDSIIGLGETCDPPETCPTTATCRTDGCDVARLSGNPATCSSRCMHSAIAECRSRDRCCPAGCNRGTDDDCSSSCGDGVLDERNGETCEPGSTIAPCPTACDDDDPCTSDTIMGSSRNCNARCAHFGVGPTDGDACCPRGANAVNDSDCEPVCGNGVTEGSEPCDGGNLCNASCRVLTMAERQCLDNVTLDTTANAACKECVCNKCTDRALGCYDSGDSGRDQRCAAVIQCARTEDCTGDACYCGSSPRCTSPNGPCRQQIEDAAESDSSTVVGQRGDDEQYALVWSTEYGQCERDQCRAECGL